MADLKISQLPAATTPLAGTEVLPIVQSSTTKQVTNNDLRPKQIQSNATSGVLQITGPAASSTRVMTVPNANFTAARTDAAQTFTGVQTFSSDNIINGITAGRGSGSEANSTTFGAAALASQSTGGYNTAYGFQALNATTGGFSNTAVGYGALKANLTANDNVAIGSNALLTSTTGASNVAVGRKSLEVATGSNNTAIGYSSGSLITSGGKNTIIGAYTGSGAPISATGSNYVVFSDGDANVRGYYDTNGNLVVPVALKGVDFSANTPAAGKTSTLLNWYEEGLVSAVLTDGTNNATMSSDSKMYYTRIGRMVYIQGYINPTNLGSVSGAVLISGLPFTVNAAQGAARSALSVGQAGGLAITANQCVTGFATAGGTTIDLRVWTATTGATQMTNTQFPANGFISFSIAYPV